MSGLAVLARTAIEIVFPRRCGGCDERGLPLLCESCASGSAPPVERGTVGFEVARAAFAHEGGPRAALLAAKLGGERRGARMLAQYLPVVDVSFTTVTAVPDSYSSRAARGGSVTVTMARAYARINGLEYRRLLERPRSGRDLGGASRPERFESMKGAFRPVRAAPEAVILVDDVVTSGATALACAAALRAAGANRLALVTFTSADRA